MKKIRKTAFPVSSLQQNKSIQESEASPLKETWYSRKKACCVAVLGDLSHDSDPGLTLDPVRLR